MVHCGQETVRVLGVGRLVEVSVPKLQCRTHGGKCRASSQACLAQVQRALMSNAEEFRGIELHPHLVRVSPEIVLTRELFHEMVRLLRTGLPLARIASILEDQYVFNAYAWLEKAGWWLGAKAAATPDDSEAAALNDVLHLFQEGANIIKVSFLT